MNISVVIPTWKGRRLLEAYLPSVLVAVDVYGKERGRETEIITVEDAGGDDTIAWLRDQYAGRIILLKHQRNLGFAAACQTGFEAAQYPIVLLLNNDVRLRPDCLAPLVKHFMDPQVFAVTGKLLNQAQDLFCNGGKVARSFERGVNGSDDKKFELLEPLLDVTVTLDPRLEIAYRFGGIFLSEGPPLGAGRPDAAQALLARGCAALPHSWRLRQDKAMLRFLFLKDAQNASRELLEASEIPGAPFWLKSLAASLLDQGGDRENARRLWAMLYETSEEGAMRQNALAHLQTLDSLDRRDAVRSAVAAFQRTKGRLPVDLVEVVRAGLLRSPAVDLQGVPFQYDPATGQVSLSRGSPLWGRGRD